MKNERNELKQSVHATAIYKGFIHKKKITLHQKQNKITLIYPLLPPILKKKILDAPTPIGAYFFKDFFLTS